MIVPSADRGIQHSWSFGSFGRPSQFRLTVHTPDQAERLIDADANCEMLVYNAGSGSIADSDDM